MRSARPFQQPAIKKDDQPDKADSRDRSRRQRKSTGTTAKGASLLNATIRPALSTPNRLSPTIMPEATSTPNRSARALRDAAVIEPADDGAHHHGKGGLHGKIDAKAHGQGRNAQQSAPCAGSRPAATMPAPITGADLDHAPVELAADHALRQCRHQIGLRRRQRLGRNGVQIGGTGKAVSLRPAD